MKPTSSSSQMGGSVQQQRWWWIAVAVVGVGLAVVLFPRPDTGADIPDADPTNTAPLEFKKAPPPARGIRPERDPAMMDPSRVRTGPKPGTEEITAKRNMPASVYSGRLNGPWGSIRRQLMIEGSDEARVLADAILPLLTDLRGNRRNPESTSMADLEERMSALRDEVMGSPYYAADPVIQSAVERYDEVIEEYHSAVEGGQPPATEEEAP